MWLEHYSCHHPCARRPQDHSSHFEHHFSSIFIYVSGTCRGGHALPRPCADAGSVGQASPLSVCQIARVHHARGLSGHRSLWLWRGTTCAKFWTVRRRPSLVCDRMPWQQACCQSRVSLGHGPRASLVKFMMFNCIVYSAQLFCIPLSACETSSPHTRQCQS